MAHCKYCHREMKTAVGCKRSKVEYGNKTYQRIKYGEEKRGMTLPCDYLEENPRCPDCGALPGHYHHVGCDMEQCPKCKTEMSSCNCGGCKSGCCCQSYR